jgi:hypothetical protein
MPSAPTHQTDPKKSDFGVLVLRLTKLVIVTVYRALVAPQMIPVAEALADTFRQHGM